MLVSRDIMLSLMLDAGKDRINRAKRYKEEGRVDIDKIEYENSRNFEVSANVYGNETYRTYISARNGEIDDITCTCPDYERTYGVCKHTLATIMELEEIISPDEVNKPKSNNIRYTNFKQIVNTFYNEEIDKIDEEEIKIGKDSGTIILEPKLIYNRFDKDLKLEFKIGNKRLYKIKSLTEFYDRMLNKEFYKYGDKLQFIHTKEMFRKDMQDLLEFVLKYSEIIKYAN